MFTSQQKLDLKRQKIDLLKSALRQTVREKQILCDILKEQDKMIQEQVARRERAEVELHHWKFGIKGN